MDLVIDTSVIIAVVLNEAAKGDLIGKTAGASLVAPGSVHWEVGNALSAMLKRKRITLIQARSALAAYRRIPIQFIDGDLNQAVDLSDQLGIYAYDVYLLAAALHQKCALLTLDRGLIQAARQLGIAVVEVGE